MYRLNVVVHFFRFLVLLGANFCAFTIYKLSDDVRQQQTEQSPNIHGPFLLVELPTASNGRFTPAF